MLGYGWTHNLDTRLILPNQPGGVAGQVLFKFQNANQLIYLDQGNGTYAPYPGVLGALVQTTSPAGFQITLPDQRVYLFDANGRLLSMRDAQNHTRTYSYTNGLLTRVEEDSSVPSEGQRFLNLGYDAQNRLQTVSDPLGRSVQFGYDANGDLTTVIDAREKTWTYQYDGAHRLTEYRNPLNQIVMRLEYDAQGRAVREFDGLSNQTIEIAYNTTDGLDGTRTFTDALGNVTIASYDWRGTLIGLQDDAGVTQKTYDENFRPSRV